VQHSEGGGQTVPENTRTIKPEITRDVIGKRQERKFTITRRDMVIDEENRTIEISFSSEFPVERWWGTEILEHSADAVMLDRLNSSGPYLNNHDTSQKLGWVMPGSAQVNSGDKKCRAVVRYSRRQEAQDEWQDVLDGAPVTVSVGYMIHELKLEESSDDGGDIYRATKWEPFEVSAAPVPADTTVGGGRSQERNEREPPTSQPSGAGADSPPNQTRTGEGEGPETGADPQTQVTERVTTMPPTTTTDERTDERTNVQDDGLAAYLRMGEFFGEIELAREFFAGDKTVEEFKAAILDKYRKQQEQLRSRRPLIQFNDRERDAYSITRAILADAYDRDRDRDGSRVEAGFEREVSQTLEREVARSIPGYKSMGGILIPTGAPLRGIPTFEQRTPLTAGGATTGSKIVFTEAGSFIDLLRHRAMLLRLGATVLSGLQGNVAFPKQTGAGSVFWMGENPGVDVTESNITLDQVTLSPKTAQATQAYSRQLLAQGVVNADALVTTDLARINALEVDRTGLHGTGTTQPLGVYGASGVNSVAFGGTITYDKVVDMETEIALDDADIGTMAYLTTPTVRGKGKKTAILANTSALPLWTGNNETGEMNGYRAAATNQVKNNMGAGTNEHGLVFAVWEHLYLGEWGMMELITDPYAKKKQGLIEVTSFLMVDWVLRYAEAFCKATGLIP
jgi:HK97 family phage major capsid protein